MALTRQKLETRKANREAQLLVKQENYNQKFEQFTQAKNELAETQKEIESLEQMLIIFDQENV